MNKSKCKSGLSDLKPPHLDSADRSTLPCWECTNCETLEALSASVVLTFSHLCPNLWHTDLPCTAVCYLTLNCHVFCLMTGCCYSQSWAEMWGMHVCSTTTEQRRTTNGATYFTCTPGMGGIQQWCHPSVLPQAAFLFSSCLHFMLPAWHLFNFYWSTLLLNINRLEV